MCHSEAKTNFFTLTHFFSREKKRELDWLPEIKRKKKGRRKKKKTSWTRELTFSISDVSKHEL